MDHVHGIEADRQIPVAVLIPLIDLHRIRAVHGLHGPVILAVLLDAEHILTVMPPVSARLPDLLVVDDRRGDLCVAVQLVDASPVLQQGVEELPAARQPVGHARSGGIEHHQVELRTELLVVALHRLLDKGKMRLEVRLVGERIDIDPLQLLPVLIASPVGAGDGFDLEGGAQQILGVFDMRPAAQVHEVVAGPVNGQQLVLGQILDELDLEFLAGKELQGVFPGDLFPRPDLFSLEDLVHLILNGLIIVLGDGARKDEVIVKTVRDLRSDRVLNLILSEDLDHGLRQHMGEGMTVTCKISFLVHDISFLILFIIAFGPGKVKKRRTPGAAFPSKMRENHEIFVKWGKNRTISMENGTQVCYNLLIF